MIQETIRQVIEILKKSDQTIIFLDSKICPIRQLVGKSESDVNMKSIAKNLKDLNVIKSFHGFTSMAGPGPCFLYISSFTLTEDFFQKNKKPKFKQLTLQL